MLGRNLIKTGVLSIACFAAWQSGTASEPPTLVPPKPEISDSKTYLLRYRFRVNQVVRYEVSQAATIKLVRDTISQTDEHSAKEYKHFAVTAVDDKQNVILEPVIDRTEMSAKHNGQLKASYDSKFNKKPPREFEGIAKVIGKPLVQLRISPTGRLLKAVPLLDEKTQKAVTSNAGPVTDPSDPSKNFLVVLPEKPVVVGDKWQDTELTVQLQIDRGLNLWRDYKILRTYRLVSVKDNLATIELSMASMKPVRGAKLQVQMVQRLMDGTIVFDLNKGQIVSRTMSVDNKVFGFAGPRSMMHVITTRVEKLAETTRTASR